MSQRRYVIDDNRYVATRSTLMEAELYKMAISLELIHRYSTSRDRSVVFSNCEMRYSMCMGLPPEKTLQGGQRAVGSVFCVCHARM